MLRRMAMRVFPGGCLGRPDQKMKKMADDEIYEIDSVPRFADFGDIGRLANETVGDKFFDYVDSKENKENRLQARPSTAAQQNVSKQEPPRQSIEPNKKDNNPGADSDDPLGLRTLAMFRPPRRSRDLAQMAQQKAEQNRLSTKEVAARTSEVKNARTVIRAGSLEPPRSRTQPVFSKERDGRDIKNARTAFKRSNSVEPIRSREQMAVRKDDAPKRTVQPVRLPKTLPNNQETRVLRSRTLPRYLDPKVPTSVRVSRTKSVQNEGTVECKDSESASNIAKKCPSMPSNTSESKALDDKKVTNRVLKVNSRSRSLPRPSVVQREAVGSKHISTGRDAFFARFSTPKVVNQIKKSEDSEPAANMANKCQNMPSDSSESKTLGDKNVTNHTLKVNGGNRSLRRPSVVQREALGSKRTSTGRDAFFARLSTPKFVHPFKKSEDSESASNIAKCPSTPSGGSESKTLDDKNVTHRVVQVNRALRRPSVVQREAVGNKHISTGRDAFFARLSTPKFVNPIKKSEGDTPKKGVPIRITKTHQIPLGGLKTRVLRSRTKGLAEKASTSSTVSSAHGDQVTEAGPSVDGHM